MTQQRVIQFEYLQSLVQDSEQPGWSEDVSVSVRLLSEALTSGWYRVRFGNRGNDFVILLAIVMHARPLRGVNLDLLVRLRMAKRSDEGRLYARVSDMALAGELGMNRMTIARSTERLAEQGSIAILEVPEDLTAFRDSYGQFNGSKVYLLAGDLQNHFFEKDIQPIHRAIKSSTVETDRATSYSTAAPDRATLYSSPARTSRTNREDEESEEGVYDGAAIDRPTLVRLALAYFAERKGVRDYQPSAKEQRAAERLAQDGFSLEQIRVGIDLAFDRTPPPRHFTHCAAIVRDLARSQPEPRLPDARTQPEPGAAEARTETEVSLPPELARAVRIYTNAGRELSDDVLLRLILMAESCERAARAANASGADWLADALTLALGKAKPENLLGYADKVLGGWVLNGRVERPRHKAEDPAVLPAELAVFEQVTGRLPLRDQRELVIRLIGQNQYSVVFLKPFWQAWVAHDRKRSDLGWLDWAARGGIPESGASHASGLDVSAETLRHLEQKYAGEDEHGNHARNHEYP